MIELTPVFKIVGIAVVTQFGGVALENFGHGDKVKALNITGYLACAWVAYDEWWSKLRAIAAMFGVFV